MIEIVYSDNHIVVARKPAGLLSEGEGADCFPALLRSQLETERGTPTKALYTVHRLDRETEGLMVYALCSSAAAELSKQMQSGDWSKVYLALLWGRPEEQSGRLCDLLYYDRAKNKSFAVKRERKGVKPAALTYEVIGRPDGHRTAVRVTLETGRTHQIRVQFASRGLPLCGDRRYGAPAESGKSLCLCAAELSFTHPKSGEPMHFAVTPEGFAIS